MRSVSSSNRNDCFARTIGFPALAATSMEQARVAMCHGFGIVFKTSVSAFQPYGIYSIPEISTIGPSEQELQAKGIPYEVGRARFENNARGQITGDAEGFIKILFDPATRKLLSAHVFGEHATELVHIPMFVLTCGGTIDAFIDAVFNFPTLAESFKYAAYDGLQRLGAAGRSPGGAATARGEGATPRGRRATPRARARAPRDASLVRGHFALRPSGKRAAGDRLRHGPLAPMPPVDLELRTGGGWSPARRGRARRVCARDRRRGLRRAGPARLVGAPRLSPRGEGRQACRPRAHRHRRPVEGVGRQARPAGAGRPRVTAAAVRSPAGAGTRSLLCPTGRSRRSTRRGRGRLCRLPVGDRAARLRGIEARPGGARAGGARAGGARESRTPMMHLHHEIGRKG